MGLFNSKLFWFYIQNTGYVLRGGYFTFKTNYVNPFPVPSYEKTKKVEHIVECLVDYLLYLYDKNNKDIFNHTSNVRIWRSQLASANLRSFFVNDFIWSEEI